MRLLTIFCMLAAVMYVGAFFMTRDPEVAVNAAGAVALIYLVVLVTTATKPPFPKKFRVWIMAVAFVSIACVATSWLTQFYQSHWQRTMLLTIRNTISHNWMADTLTTRSLQTLEAYHNRPQSSKESLADVFHRLNPGSSPGTTVMDTFFSDEGRKIVEALTHVESAADSEVVLLGRDELSPKQDSIFAVLGMKVGKPVARLRLTARGVKYEFEN